MKHLIMATCATAALLVCPAGHSAATESPVTLTTYFERGVPTPFDLLYHQDEASAEGEGRYYLAKLVMRTEREGIIRLEDARTSELVVDHYIDAEGGIGDAVHVPKNPELDDFFYDNYSEWCGKVHNGRRGKWQLCTGKDCPGGGICIKHCVKVAGTCIP